MKLTSLINSQLLIRLSPETTSPPPPFAADETIPVAVLELYKRLVKSSNPMTIDEAAAVVRMTPIVIVGIVRKLVDYFKVEFIQGRGYIRAL